MQIEPGSLTPDERVLFRELLAPLTHNLAVESILAGDSPGTLFADSSTGPKSAIMAFASRLFLAGSPENLAFRRSLGSWIEERLIPQMVSAGQEAFILHTDSPAWEPYVAEILPGQSLIKAPRLYYEAQELPGDWRESMPEGFVLRPVEAGLMEETGLKNLEALQQELCSERASVEAFLEKSFGFCLQRQDELVSWCLSEYNLGDRCEVGVATVEAYQRRGLATVTTLALLEHAFTHGYRRVGWHCWKRNVPSAALAERAGFELAAEYPVYLVFLSQAE